MVQDGPALAADSREESRVADSGAVVSSAQLLGDRVASALRSDILGGRLAPGSRIRQEILAQQFGVSRIPVREALRQLESDGLVTLRANSGAWVAKIDLGEFIEIYKIRERLEPLALQESVKNLTEGQIEHLNRLREGLDHCRSVEEFLQLDREFHVLTYAGANMPTLRGMIERFWNTTQHYRRAFTQSVDLEGAWVIQAEHRLLLEAMRRRDESEAARILLGHIRRTRLELTSRAKSLGLG